MTENPTRLRCKKNTKERGCNVLSTSTPNDNVHKRRLEVAKAIVVKSSREEVADLHQFPEGFRETRHSFWAV